MNTIVSQKMSRGQGNELLNALEAAGMMSDLAQKIVDSKNNDLAAKVVQLIQSGGFEPSSSQQRAREIMGRNFFGIEEAIKHLGVNPSKQQLAFFAEIPWSEEVLQSVKDSHILVAVFPLSILDIRGKAPRKLFRSHEDAWYNKQTFAKDRGEIGWRLVRKTPVENSTSKTWNEQQGLLSTGEETPKAQVMVYAIIGHFLATGDRLFESVYVRCVDLDSYGHRVCVGSFGPDGLDVLHYWGGDRYGSIGLSGVRKQ